MMNTRLCRALVLGYRDNRLVIRLTVRLTRALPTASGGSVALAASDELFNINRTKPENLIHRILAAGRLKIEVTDRFGNPVVPREWFLAPLHVIDDALEKIKNGTIG